MSQIHEMSDEDLSRAIAELAESKPTEPGESYVCDPDYSAGGFWQWRLSPGCTVKVSWQPRWMMSPCASMMLLQKMADDPDRQLILRSQIIGEFNVHFGANDVDGKLGRAIAECFYLSLSKEKP